MKFVFLTMGGDDWRSAVRVAKQVAATPEVKAVGADIKQGAAEAGDKLEAATDQAGEKLKAGAEKAGDQIKEGAQKAGDKTDAALNKRFSTPIETLKVEFRSEFYNIFNHANLYLPSTIGGTNGATASTGGQITSTFQPRVVQFALKVLF